MDKYVERSSSRKRQATDPNTPADVLVELAKSTNWKIRWAIAKNPSTPADTLVDLSNDTDWEVRVTTLTNPNIPVHILNTHAEEVNEGQYYYIATNIAAPVSVLIKLIENSDEFINDESIKFWVTQNPNCPEAVKIWVNNGGFADLPLAEFLEKVDNG
jgi:sulfur relay (sulfurtransferase) DsrC/TusE family protein